MKQLLLQQCDPGDTVQVVCGCLLKVVVGARPITGNDMAWPLAIVLRTCSKRSFDYNSVRIEDMCWLLEHERVITGKSSWLPAGLHVTRDPLVVALIEAFE